MTHKRVERELGAGVLSIEVGKVAKLAHGSALVQYGDTVVLAAVTTTSPREGIDFFPLTVDYREKTYAAGKIPGGFFKREGRPSAKEILTMRMIDRPIRPLFPEGYRDEVLIQTMVLSADQVNDPDVLAMIGASAALSVSPIPFDGPIGAVRIGRDNGELVIFPTHAQSELSDLDMVMTGTGQAVNMIEVGSKELSENVVMEAVRFGHGYVAQINEMIDELAKEVGKPKVFSIQSLPEGLLDKVAGDCEADLRDKQQQADKETRKDAITELKNQLVEKIAGADQDNPIATPGQVKDAFDRVNKKVVRELILQGKRPDGRGPEEIRPLSCEVGVLPRTHGSAIFSRGQTQALVVVTLGTVSDEQIIDGLTEEYSKKFMLHYNFPPFSVGEVRRIVGPSRRDIGHGALSEKSIEGVLPSPDEFPYTIRVVSDILESNGSSSMASVCGSTLSLMDAGVPIKHPVAGISIGWVHEDGKDVLITDILGEEDHYGDMDFKVAGSQNGITGIQMDLKAKGISFELIEQTLERARNARLEILRSMLGAIGRPRPEISPYAPRLLTIRIDPEKIGKVIGPGGKGIKQIQKDSGAQIDIEDDGTVYISCMKMEGAEMARAAVEAVTEEVRVGRIYTGKVSSIKDFGAFVEVVPGQDGLCHISELADQYVKNVQEIVSVGDSVRVKVINVDEQGRIKLSRKAALRDDAQTEEA